MVGYVLRYVTSIGRAMEFGYAHVHIGRFLPRPRRLPGFRNPYRPVVVVQQDYPALRNSYFGRMLLVYPRVMLVSQQWLPCHNHTFAVAIRSLVAPLVALPLRIVTRHDGLTQRSFR